MIGFVTTPEISAAITAAIGEAQLSRGLGVTWLLEGLEIRQGEHAGQHFIPADDGILACPVREDYTPVDFPEFAELVGLLGGLGARLDVGVGDLVES